MSKQRCAYSLSQEQVSEFWRNGFLGPFALCAPGEMEAIRERVFTEVLTTPGPCTYDERGLPDKFSCRHLDSLIVRGLCTSPAIIEKVASILGRDLILVSSRIWVKDYNSKEIPWHQDGAYWPIYPKVGVSVWLALTQSTVSNGCVNLIQGSHKDFFPIIPASEGKEFDTMIDPRHTDGVEKVCMTLNAGEFFVFDFNLLHQSDRNGSRACRAGLSIQMSVPFVEVERDWFFPDHKVMLVSGEDHYGINNLIGSSSL